MKDKAINSCLRSRNTPLTRWVNFYVKNEALDYLTEITCLIIYEHFKTNYILAKIFRPIQKKSWG